MKKLLPSEKKKFTGIRLTDSLKIRIQKFAESDDRSFNSAVIILLQKALKDQK